MSKCKISKALNGAPGEIRTPDLTLRSCHGYPSMDGLEAAQLLQAKALAEMANSDPSMHTTGRAIPSGLKKSKACHKRHHKGYAVMHVEYPDMASPMHYFLRKFEYHLCEVYRHAQSFAYPPADLGSSDHQRGREACRDHHGDGISDLPGAHFRAGRRSDPEMSDARLPSPGEHASIIHSVSRYPVSKAAPCRN